MSRWNSGYQHGIALKITPLADAAQRWHLTPLPTPPKKVRGCIIHVAGVGVFYTAPRCRCVFLVAPVCMCVCVCDDLMLCHSARPHFLIQVDCSLIENVVFSVLLSVEIPELVNDII